VTFDPRKPEVDPRSVLRWFERAATRPDEVTERVVPEGPATFVVGDRWVTVARGEVRIVMVEPGIEPRLATEADVLAQG
jgi:hypothetical protein